MGAGNSKNENAKPESCIECDLMDSMVDAVCDAVSEKIIESNPNDANDEETVKCNNKLIVDLRKNVREFVIEAKEFQKYFNNKTEELKYSLETLDKEETEKIHDEVYEKLLSKKLKKIALVKQLDALGKDGKRQAIEDLKSILFKGKSVLNNINEKDEECFWCVETVTKMTSELLAWIKKLMDWFFEKVLKTFKWCTLSLGNVGKCVLIGAAVALLVIAIICQAKTNYKTVLESEYNSKSMGKNENIMVLERRSRGWKTGNDVFGVSLAKPVVQTGLNWFTNFLKIKEIEAPEFTEKVVDIREDNFGGYFWSNACPYLVYSGRFVRHIPVLKDIMYVLDGRFLTDTVGFENMSYSELLYNFGYDSSRLLIGLNTEPILVKYFTFAQTSTNWYHGMHTCGSLLTIGTAYASPAALINPYAQMAVLGGNLYWEMTVGMDMRNYAIAVMERNILRPLLLKSIKKIFGTKSEKWVDRLDAMAEIVSTGQQVFFMYKGLTNPRQISMNFVRSAIKLKKMEDMEVKTLGDKAEAKLKQIVDKQEKMLKNQNELLEKMENLTTELYNTHKEVQEASNRAQEFEIKLVKLQDDYATKIMEEQDKDTKEILEINKKHQAEVKRQLSIMKNYIVNGLQKIANNTEKMAESEKIQDEVAKERLKKTYLLQYIESLSQFKLEDGKIFTKVSEEEWRLTKDEEILVWVKKRKDERNEIYAEWSALREGNMPEVPEKQKEKIIGSFYAYKDTTQYTVKKAREELINTLLNGMSENDKQFQKRMISVEEYNQNIPGFIHYYNLKPGPKLKF
ncbi:MAG: hypothetical protein CMF41_04375 [Legionellales bacterium]|nr:hypothetical protein [Legionellales bacterium]